MSKSNFEITEEIYTENAQLRKMIFASWKNTVHLSFKLQSFEIVAADGLVKDLQTELIKDLQTENECLSASCASVTEKNRKLRQTIDFLRAGYDEQEKQLVWACRELDKPCIQRYYETLKYKIESLFDD